MEQNGTITMFEWLFKRNACAPPHGRRRPPIQRRVPAGLSTKLADQEDKWNAVAETIGFVVAAYTHGDETIVDVLRVNGAYLNNRHTLVLDVAAPKLVKDRTVGGYLEWDRRFELPIECLRRFEPLHPDFWRDGPEAYQSAIARVQSGSNAP